MSLTHFELGLRALQHEEGRQFLVAARAVNTGMAGGEQYNSTVQEESAILGIG